MSVHGGVRMRLGRVAIVGAGQVGTMLGMALLRPSLEAGVDEVGLFDADRSVAEASLGRGAGHRILDGHLEVLESDTVVLALPVREIVTWVGRFAGDMKRGSLVVDTGSAKRAVVEAMRHAVLKSVHAVGGHPVAGTEQPGPEGARPDLLEGAAFVLTPVRDDPEAMARGRMLAAAVGARPVEIEADLHDRILACTSHLPHVMAFALALVAGRTGSDGDLVRELAAGGFEGATRLGASDPGMVAGFLSCNADEVRRVILDLEDRLEEILAALAAGPEALARLLSRARAALERVR